MGRQAQTYPTLKMLGREALAAATVLEADVFLSAESPELRKALDAETIQSFLLTDGS
jgi:hypothetical protein